jgi:hypothetical protein
MIFMMPFLVSCPLQKSIFTQANTGAYYANHVY